MADVDTDAERAEMRDGAAHLTARRHPWLRRVNHWINVVCVIMLIMTGLNIFGAHPAIYWGRYGSEYDHPLLKIRGMAGHGTLTIGNRTFDTTGLLGWSAGHHVTFPGWATLPGFQDLADARNWHFLLAWTLILNGIIYWIYSLSRRHIQRDLVPTASELKPSYLWADIKAHAMLRFPKGWDSNRYHILQKGAYLSAVAILIPGMIVTGLCMSPGADAVLPGIVDLLGGRQSARTLHFILMWGLIGFILIHVAAVAVAGLGNQLRSMITGRWAFRNDGDAIHGPTTLAADVR